MDVYIRELSCKSVSRIWSRLVSVSIDWEIYLYFEHSGFPIPWAMHQTPESISCSCRTWISFNILIFFFFKSRKSLNKIDTQSPTLNSICMWNIWGSKFNIDWYFGINLLIYLTDFTKHNVSKNFQKLYLKLYNVTSFIRVQQTQHACVDK